jgi:uncharacterized lipoprotein YmbA
VLTANAPIRPVSIAVLLICLLAGCGGGSTPVRHYVINSVTTSDYPAAPSGTAPVVEIMDLSIPQYLERAPIATRIGDNRLHLSETARWGENLRKNLLRALAGNLSSALGSDHVGTPLSRSSSTPDVRLQLHIEQFEKDAAGIVRLQARWQLSDGATNQPFANHSASLAADVSRDAGDYDAIVADMQSVFSDLGFRIAESILSAESAH